MSRLAVVDGVTGYVGANFVHHLLRRGRRVVALARAEEAAVRATVADAVIGRSAAEPVDLSELQVERFALDADDLGLGERAADVFGEPCDYWHVAASMRYMPGSSAELMAVNVEGTRHAVECFRRAAPAGSRFFLVSSVYACGLADGPVAEQWHEHAPPSAFRNYYEFSKRESELVLRPYLEAGEIEGAVLRLGAIMADSASCETNNRYGFYDLLERVHRVAQRWPGTRVRVVGDPTAALAYVPVDVCARWMEGLADAGVDALDPPIVHVVDAPAVPVQPTFDLLPRHAPVELQLVASDEVADDPVTHIETMVEAGMTFTGGYLSKPTEFDRSNLDKLLGAPPPATDLALLDRFIEWFVADLTATKARRLAAVREAAGYSPPPGGA